MAMPGAVPIGVGDVDARLARFGLSVADLHGRVVLPASGLSRVVTPFHPWNERGRVFYAEATAGLRRVGVEKGWNCDDTDGVARSVSPDGTVVVVVATGNEFTGLPGAEAVVTTKFNRGPRLLDGVVSELGYTLDKIAPEVFPFTSPAPTSPVREVWLLLLCPAAGEVRIELSRPEGRDVAGFPRPFIERILIPPLRTGDIGDGDFDLGDGDIDVPVLDR